MTAPTKTKIPVCAEKNCQNWAWSPLLLPLLVPHLSGIFSYEIVFEGFPITLFYYGVLFNCLDSGDIVCSKSNSGF